MLVVTTDFVGELAYADDEQQVKRKKLCKFIEQYEPEFREYALGYALNELFEAGVTASEQRWLDLRDGVAYTVNGVEFKYKGIKPLIQRYVYFFYMRDEATTVTMTGEKAELAANASAAGYDKAIRQWNLMSRDMFDDKRSIWKFLCERVGEDGDKVYPEFDGCQVDYKVFRSINEMNI